MKNHLSTLTLLQTLIVFSAVAFAERSEDPAVVAEKIRSLDMVIVVSANADEATIKLAEELSAASGCPVVDDSFVVLNREKETQWSYFAHNFGKKVIALGENDGNFYIEKSFKPMQREAEPLVKDGTLSVLCYFSGENDDQKPWLGDPFALIYGADSATLRNQVNRLAEALKMVPAPSARTVWFESPRRTTLPKERRSVERDKWSLQWEGCVNERLWGKLVVNPGSIDSVDIRLSPFKGPVELPAPKLNRLAYRRKGKAMMDDVVVPLASRDGTTYVVPVKPESANPFLLEFRVSPKAKPGLYESDVTVAVGDDITKTTIALTVRDAELPAESPIPVYYYGAYADYPWRQYFRAVGDDAKFERALRSFAHAYKRFGATDMPGINYYYAVKWIMDDDADKFRIDYSAFDRFIEIMREEGLSDGRIIIKIRTDRGRRDSVGGYGRAEIYDSKGVHWHKKYSPEGELIGKNAKNANGEPMRRVSRVKYQKMEKATPYLKDLAEHMKEKGWLERTYIYCDDEPDDVEKYLENCEHFTKHGFKVTTAISTNRIDLKNLDLLVGTMDHWVLNFQAYRNLHDRWQDFAAERRAAGEPVWWYHCLGLGWFNRGLDYGSSFGLQSWIYNVDGIAYWSPFSIDSIPKRKKTPLDKATWDDHLINMIGFYWDDDSEQLLGSRRMAVISSYINDVALGRTFDQWRAKLDPASPLKEKFRDMRGTVKSILSEKGSSPEKREKALKTLRDAIEAIKREVGKAK